MSGWTKAARVWAQLQFNCSGIAMTEFALVMPLFLAVALWGIELANYQLAIMKMEQVAAGVADNGSRIGDYSTLQNRKIYESDIDDLFVGASLAAGKLDVFNKGRIILSSVEVNTAGKQYIHWQRCVGKKAVVSSYGKQGDVLTDAGIGPTGSKVPATANDAVMFVEVQYDYEPLISTTFIGNPTIKSIFSYTVRSSRDLSQVYQTTRPSPMMTCSKYTNSVA
jgi:Flp pilus assembly protein TadG